MSNWNLFVLLFGIPFGIHSYTFADLVSKNKNVWKDSFFGYSKRLVIIFSFITVNAHQPPANAIRKIKDTSYSNKPEKTIWNSHTTKLINHNSHHWSKEDIVMKGN